MTEVPVQNEPDLLEPRPGWLFSRFQGFLATESASGLVLMVATVLALIWANLPHLAEGYHELWHTVFSVGIPRTDWMLSLDLHHWINDGLMVAFFFIVGLEIKRELLVGELSQFRHAMLPIFGAIGGMVVPALIYTALNRGLESAHGWGVPVATDIAFALAILALLGRRIPIGLKVFLVALAIVDDLGAVAIIALFYTSDLNVPALSIAGVGLVVAALMNWRGVSRTMPYAGVGMVVWLAVLLSGVHATVAGVLMAFTIPASAKIDLRHFYGYVKRRMQRLEATVNPEVGEQEIPRGRRRLTHGQADMIYEMERACWRVQPPLDRLEHTMLPWIAFGIVPLFALANAGVTLPDEVGAELLGPVSLGIILGLVLGKQLGVTLFVWLAVKLRLADLPAGVNWWQIYGAAWICGVGFTMSLFIAHLAFGVGELLDSAKIGILSASLLAGLIGYLILRKVSKLPEEPSAGLGQQTQSAA